MVVNGEVDVAQTSTGLVIADPLLLDTSTYLLDVDEHCLVEVPITW